MRHDLPKHSPIAIRLGLCEPPTQADKRPRKSLKLKFSKAIARDVDKTPTPANENDFLDWLKAK